MLFVLEHLIERFSLYAHLGRIGQECIGTFVLSTFMKAHLGRIVSNMLSRRKHVSCCIVK